jgi:hypothetical protein
LGDDEVCRRASTRVKKPTAWAAEAKQGMKNSTTTATTNGDLDLLFNADFSVLDGLGGADDDNKETKEDEEDKEDEDKDVNNEGVPHSLSASAKQRRAKKQKDKSAKLAPVPGAAVAGSAVIATGQASRSSR